MLIKEHEWNRRRPEPDADISHDARVAGGDRHHETLGRGLDPAGGREAGGRSLDQLSHTPFDEGTGPLQGLDRQAKQQAADLWHRWLEGLPHNGARVGMDPLEDGDDGNIAHDRRPGLDPDDDRRSSHQPGIPGT